MGGACGLDLRDVDREANALEFRHRPDSGTPLKKHERGEHGRQPLLVTSNGRVALSTLRDWSYFATVLCRVQDCQHGKQKATCDWFTSTKAVECPSSRSPHRVWSGSITWQRNRGMDAEIVARPVNASVRVIDEHYDLPSKREEFEQRGAEHVEKLNLDASGAL